MSHEYYFDIRPNGVDALQVIFKGRGQPQNGSPFPRSLPTIAAKEIETFRRGESDMLGIVKLAESVSEWLLKDDLRPLVAALEQTIEENFRFIFSIDASLQQAIGDIPVELLQTEADRPLILLSHADGMLHLLPKVGRVDATAEHSGWPMRILLVRSNPQDLGGEVPIAAPIRNKIMAIGNAAFGNGMVQVDVLSSETGAIGPPTWEWFMKTVPAGYDILIYVGHGDIYQLYADLPPISQLQFEKENNPKESEPVTSKQLAAVLHRSRIPVVLLAGCLTAASPKAEEYPHLSEWMRGNQGVAQALVNSASGVTFAVGMRSKIQDKAAELFLEKFFEGLFIKNKGNVEHALRFARQELSLRPALFPSWAAPVAFSSLAPEPLFPYLANSGPVSTTAAIDRELAIRRQVLWPLLADLPAGDRPPSVMSAVVANREALSTEVSTQGSMLIPELLETTAGHLAVLKITLEGNFVCHQLQVKLSLPAGLSFETAKATQILSTSEYEVLMDRENAIFQIQAKQRDMKRQLPTGVIVEVELQVAANANGVYPISLEVLSTDSNEAYWAGNNAVIVSV